MNVPYVLVDGGDFIMRDDTQGDLESVATWKDMNARGYNAVTLGEMELSRWDLTSQMMKDYPLPIVCSNVEQLENGRWLPIGEQTRIVDVNGVRIGFISVIGEGQLSRAMIDKTNGAIQLLPPMETATALAAKLRKQVDIVVLLAHIDPRAMDQYATLLPDVDVIVGGHAAQNDEGPTLVGGAIVNRAGTKGQLMGITRLILSPMNEIVDFGGLNFTLSPGYAEDEAVKAEVKRVKEESNQLKRARAQASRDERLKELGEQPDSTAAPNTAPVIPPAQETSAAHE